MIGRVLHLVLIVGTLSTLFRELRPIEYYPPGPVDCTTRSIQATRWSIGLSGGRRIFQNVSEMPLLPSVTSSPASNDRNELYQTIWTSYMTPPILIKNDHGGRAIEPSCIIQNRDVYDMQWTSIASYTVQYDETSMLSVVDWEFSRVDLAYRVRDPEASKFNHATRLRLSPYHLEEDRSIHFDDKTGT